MFPVCKSFLYITVLAFLAAGLMSCGGGSSPSNPSDIKGRFIDSPVEGLYFHSDQQSGMTGTDGTFYYKDDAEVTFSIGDIVIGAATGYPVISPVSLVAGANDESHPVVINIARFLQTLDVNNDLTDGIQITSLTHDAALGKTVNFSQSVTQFEDDGSVQTIIAELTAASSGVSRTLISAQEAQSNLRDGLLDEMSGTYIGTLSGDGTGAWRIVIDKQGIISGTGRLLLFDDNYSLNLAGILHGSGSFTMSDSDLLFSGDLKLNKEIVGDWSVDTIGLSGSFVGNEDHALDIAKRSGCFACHSIEQKVVGPAWIDVAKRYDVDDRIQLIEKVKMGGSGNWTEVTAGVPMPPYSPRVTDNDIEILVDFILSLDN